MNKHAYLIMAHNEPVLLLYLLKCLDDERNDIFLHFDKSFKEISPETIEVNIKHASYEIIESEEVEWGSYSQINVTYKLLKTAFKHNNYSYYHFISGVDLPLKTQNELHYFFEENYGQEFMSYGKVNEWVIARRYQHFYYPKLIRIFNRTQVRYINYLLGIIQRILFIKKKLPNNFEFHMGGNWFSITNHLVKILIEKENFVNALFRNGFLVDEIAFNSVLMNSDRRIKVSEMQNLRYVDWKRGNPYVWTINEYEELISKNIFFARKFSLNKDKEIIEKICKEIHNIKESPII